MRVIAGKAKGVVLAQVPTGVARASLGRVRESLFASLGADLVDARVLDLFSGTGSLGIEALSRGASEACFVDNSRSSLTVLESNLERTRLLEQARLVQQNVLTLFRKELLPKEPFDLVFVDPPYPLLRDQKLSKRFATMFDELFRSGTVSRDGWVVVKHECGALDGLEPPGAVRHRRQNHRHADVSWYTCGEQDDVGD